MDSLIEDEVFDALIHTLTVSTASILVSQVIEFTKLLVLNCSVSCVRSVLARYSHSQEWIRFLAILRPVAVSKDPRLICRICSFLNDIVENSSYFCHSSRIGFIQRELLVMDILDSFIKTACENTYDVHLLDEVLKLLGAMCVDSMELK